MILTPTEEKIWEKSSPKSKSKKMTDEEINAKYERGEQRILTETNREKLPSFVEALKKPNYMNLRPFYQRRSRWDAKMQSRLIESFLVSNSGHQHRLAEFDIVQKNLNDKIQSLPVWVQKLHS